MGCLKHANASEGRLNARQALGANGTRLNACGKHLGAIETMASTRSERPSLERLA